jgi:hypothetical protein
MKDIVLPIIEEHQAYINSGENPDEMFKRLLEICQKINLQLELITPNSKAEWEAIGLAKELFEKGDIQNGYETLKPFFPSQFSAELLAFSFLAASISFTLATYVEVRLGIGKLVPFIIRPIMMLLFVFITLKPVSVKVFLPIFSVLFAFQLPHLIKELANMGLNGLYTTITMIILSLVVLSRPIFKRENGEWLWGVLIALLVVFLMGIICYSGPPMPRIPR